MMSGSFPHSRLLAVFISNKLISCDAIMPVVLEAKRVNPQLEVRFYTSQHKTLDVIRRNVVLWEALHSVGSILLIGRRNGSRLEWIMARLRFISVLLSLGLKALTGQLTLLHFKALNDWPLRLLFYLAPGQTIYCDASIAGYSRNEQIVDNLWYQRPVMRRPPAAGRLMAFVDTAPVIVGDFTAGFEKHVLGKQWQGAAWVDFVKSAADRHMPDGEKVITYILGYLGHVEFVDSDQTFLELLRRTLTVLARVAPSVTVCIKPHYNTDLNLLNETVQATGSSQFRIVDLHPSVLALRSRFFIGNYYSTTMVHARAAGLPVVEFSNYGHEARAKLAGSCIRPDVITHFVDNDDGKLAEVVASLCTALPPAANMRVDTDKTGIIALLSGISPGPDNPGTKVA